VLARLPKLTNLALGSQLFSAADVTAGVAVVAGQLTRLTFEYEPGAGNLRLQMRMVYEAWSDEPVYGDEDGMWMESGIAEDAARVEKEIMEEGNLLSNLSALTAACAPPLIALRELELRNLTIHDKGWEALCAALAAGTALPCVIRVEAECLELSALTHAIKPCGSLSVLVLDHCDEQAVRGRLQPAVQLTCTPGVGRSCPTPC
jgi:hypothetical protein